LPREARMVASTLLELRLDFASKPPFTDVEDARAPAQAIVDTIREPLLALDKDLCVVTANCSFYICSG
jgi:hypothetical protein